MDHWKQMKKILSTKEFLLQNSLAEDEKPVIYSLEAEFAKAKKNRDYKPLLVFWGFVFLMVWLTLGTVRILERQSKQINIDISDFEDLRLKEALSEAEELRGANEDLESYHYALETMLKEKKADGCVIDPRQADNIMVFVNQEVTAEVEVKLYRSNNVYVGKIKLIPDLNRVRAEMIEAAKKQKVKPFDWFRLPSPRR
jgi:hypothetical protein